MSEAAFKATYSDVRTIKTRKVVQFVFEVAQEQANKALECLGGLPRSDVDTWVAIARLEGSHGGLRELEGVQGSTEDPPLARRWHEMRPSQQAGIRCNDPQFMAWVARKLKSQSLTSGEVAGFVRDYCMVTSRSELDTNKNAQDIWHRLDMDFQIETGRRAEQR